MTDIHLDGPPDPDNVSEPVDLIRHNHILVYCDCSAAFSCPQGKSGSQIRCSVWMKQSHVTEEGKAAAREARRYTR
jgi:hypothetical protein